MIPPSQVFDLTIDVCVLMDGSGISTNTERYTPSRRLMQKVKLETDYMLSVDHKGKIEYQYSQKLGHGTLGHHWLRQLAQMGKIVPVKSVRLNRGVLTKLKEAHFHQEDYKYVETSAATQCKFLVSRDRDYSRKVRSILRRYLDVIVVNAESFL